MTPIEMATTCQENTPPDTNGLLTTGNVRLMRHANGHARHHKIYMNHLAYTQSDIASCANDPTNKHTKTPANTLIISDSMWNVDDRTTNTDTIGIRGRRGRRAPRSKNRGRGFHLNLNAEMALTQHLLRRGPNLKHAATDAISFTIGNFTKHLSMPANSIKASSPRQSIAPTSSRPTLFTYTILRAVKTSRAPSHTTQYRALLCPRHISQSS
jgi:hypothetical protein